MLRPCSRADRASSIPKTKHTTACDFLGIFRVSPVFGSVAESMCAIKCRLCSSGLYISMTAPLSTSACSSLVKVSDLPESSGSRPTTIVSKIFSCGFASSRGCLFMESVRGDARLLSDYFNAVPALLAEQAPLQLFLREQALSSHHLLKRADKVLHFRFRPNGKPHVIRHRWKQPANCDVFFLHRFDERHDRFLTIEHDEVGL